MKKLVLMFAVVFSASLFSCGNNETTAAANDTVDTVAVETLEVTDTVVCDSAAADTVAADTTVAQ